MQKKNKYEVVYSDPMILAAEVTKGIHIDKWRVLTP